MHKRAFLRGTSALLGAPALAACGVVQAEAPAVQRLGVFSLLGHSVRVVARELQEVMFKDIGMDEVVINAADTALKAHLPQAQLLPFRSAEQIEIDEQLRIGTAASLQGSLPAWIVKAASEAALTHALLINCNAGSMAFRTGLSQVVGNNRVTGVGFYVSADGRFKNERTGVVSSGYLAPFVQLRLTLLGLAGPRALKSATVGEGFVAGPPVSEAPDPWKFLSRQQKAGAIQRLLQTTVARGVEQLLG